jgi:cystine transport system ATP-binding protein
VLGRRHPNALDERGREQVLSVLAECKQEGVTMVLTTHDERMASWLADGIVRLEAGRIVECSSK